MYRKQRNKMYWAQKKKKKRRNEMYEEKERKEINVGKTKCTKSMKIMY